jgi:RND family efflux transporter MFP subunit
MRAEVFGWRLRLEVAVGLLACCTAEGEHPEPPAGPKSVRCVQVASARLEQSVELRGTIAPLPDRDAQVAAQVGGRILRVLVREGEAVKAGQVVAQIDPAPLLDQAHGADAALARARAEHKNAETSLVRVQRVFEHGIAARQEVDDAAARAASAQASEDEAAAAAQRAHFQLDRATVRSPLDGVVLKVMHRTGELVDGTPTTAIVEVGDPSQLELVADAPAQDLMRVKVGGAAQITLSAVAGHPLTGHVSAVAPALDRATGLGVVRVALEPGQGQAPPVGAYATARVQTGEARAALIVPVAALRAAASDEGELIACGPDAVAHVRKVRRGEVRDGLAEITSGVQAGDRVVLEPVLGLSEGDALKVLP